MPNERYTIRRTLGRGAQGETFLAWDEARSRNVALKHFRIGNAQSWKAVELAEREVRILALLDHPGCARYVEHYEDAGTLVLVMEYVEGESLAALRDRAGAVSPDVVWAFLDAIAATLRYLRTFHPPIVHRDIKPSNVIRRPDGSFVLVDFGSVAQRLVAEGTTVTGTFGYMAPEQFHGSASPASDVYSVGATAMALLTGKEPEALPRKGLQVDVAAALPDLKNSPLGQAIQRMLLVDPQARGDDLQAILAQPSQARTSSYRSTSLRRAALIAMAGVTAVGVGVTSLLLHTDADMRLAKRGGSPLPERVPSAHADPQEQRVPSLEAGAPVAILPPQHRVGRVAVDDSGVYFFAGSAALAGTWLEAIHPPSGDITELARVSEVSEIAVDAASVYWVGDKGVAAVPKTGGPVRTIASEDMSIRGKRAHWTFPTIAVGDDAFVYFTNDKSLRRAPREGGTGHATVLYTGADGLRVIAVSEDQVFFLEICQVGHSEGDSIAEDLRVISTDRQKLRTVARNLHNVWTMAVDYGSIYWLAGTSEEQDGRWRGALYRMPREGGAATSLTELDPTLYPAALGLDGRRVYWLERTDGGGRVMSLERGDPWQPTRPGTQPMQLASARGWAHGLAVDASRVYWWGDGISAIAIPP